MARWPMRLFKALVAIGLFGMVAIGFLFTRLTLVERVVAFVAALCLLGEFHVSAIPSASRSRPPSCVWQWRQRPRDAAAAA